MSTPERPLSDPHNNRNPDGTIQCCNNNAAKKFWELRYAELLESNRAVDDSWNWGTMGGGNAIPIDPSNPYTANPPPKTSQTYWDWVIVERNEGLGGTHQYWTRSTPAPDVNQFRANIASKGQDPDEAMCPECKTYLEGLRDNAETILPTVLHVVSSVAAFIPGVGTAVAVVLGGAAALADGENIGTAVIDAAEAAIPASAAIKAGYEAGKAISQGKGLDEIALGILRSTCVDELGDVGGVAFDSVTAIAAGKSFQDVGFSVLKVYVKGSGLADQGAAFADSLAQSSAIQQPLQAVLSNNLVQQVQSAVGIGQSVKQQLDTALNSLKSNTLLSIISQGLSAGQLATLMNLNEEIARASLAITTNGNRDPNLYNQLVSNQKVLPLVSTKDLSKFQLTFQRFGQEISLNDPTVQALRTPLLGDMLVGFDVGLGTLSNVDAITISSSDQTYRTDGSQNQANGWDMGAKLAIGRNASFMNSADTKDRITRGSAISDRFSSLSIAKSLYTDGTYLLGFVIATSLYAPASVGGDGKTNTGPGALQIRSHVGYYGRLGFDVATKILLGDLNMNVTNPLDIVNGLISKVSVPTSSTLSDTQKKAQAFGQEVASIDPNVAGIRNALSGDRLLGFDIGFGQLSSGPYTQIGPGTQATRPTFSADAAQGWDTGIKVALTRNQDADQDQEINQYLAAGAQIAKIEPVTAAARLLEGEGQYRYGFDVGTGMFASTALGGRGLTSIGPGGTVIRSKLGIDGSRGFLSAAALQFGKAKNIGNQAISTDPTTAAGQLITSGLIGSSPTQPSAFSVMSSGGVPVAQTGVIPATNDAKLAVMSTVASVPAASAGATATLQAHQSVWTKVLHFFGLA